ncbi:hypothetical protein [Streptomyces adelaidensis]|nr:hypothetical protein [Streptomyces adelaidensis]
MLPRDRCGARHIGGITAIRVAGGYGYGYDHLGAYGLVRHCENRP